MNEPTNSKGETFEEFVARKVGGEPKEMNRPEREGFPPGWDQKERKRAEQHPPDFEEQEATAITYATVHGRMWSPAVVDCRRLEDGKAALLLRDKKQDFLMVVLDGLEVEDFGTKTEFYETEEVVL